MSKCVPGRVVDTFPSIIFCSFCKRSWLDGDPIPECAGPVLAPDAVDLVLHAVNGTDPTPIEVVALFAERDNWVQVRDAGRCWWAWAGPNVPPYELPQRVIERERED